MEIYETISHVSTNQVWLHINFTSSRVYFRPFTLCFSVLLGRCGPTYQKLPSWYPTSLLPLLPSNSCPPSLSLSVSHTPTLLLSTELYLRNHPCADSSLSSARALARLIRVHAIVNPLSYSSPEIVYLNHPRLPRNTEAPF